MDIIAKTQIRELETIINKEYTSPEELHQALDELMYSLFHINLEDFNQQRQQNCAYTVMQIKRALHKGAPCPPKPT